MCICLASCVHLVASSGIWWACGGHVVCIWCLCGVCGMYVAYMQCVLYVMVTKFIKSSQHRCVFSVTN